MLPNIPAMLEAHFGVPMIGAVLNALNVRLDAEAIAFMLAHGEAKVLIADREFHDVVHAAIGMLDHPPLVIDVDDPEYGEGQPVSDLDYEAFLAEGDPDFAWQWPADEWQAISLNYTSGTDRQPQGRGLPPPWGLPELPGQPNDLGDRQPPGVPVDAADVPLQRLVLPVDHHGLGRGAMCFCAASTHRESST